MLAYNRMAWILFLLVAVDAMINGKSLLMHLLNPSTNQRSKKMYLSSKFAQNIYNPFVYLCQADFDFWKQWSSVYSFKKVGERPRQRETVYFFPQYVRFTHQFNVSEMNKWTFQFNHFKPIIYFLLVKKKTIYIYVCVCVCVFHWFISFIYFIYLFLLFISFLFSFPFSFSLRVERIFKKKPFTHGSKRGKMNLSSSLHG